MLIVSNDAGGAEILSAWCSRHTGRYEINCALSGPAVNIFKRDKITFTQSPIETIGSQEAYDFVLTGTSLEADIEREAIHLAKKHDIRCITFLDHWDLYKERFGDRGNWLTKLPDEVWVGDYYAYYHALKEGFPEGLLRLVENPYFTKILSLRFKFEKKTVEEARKTRKILFICEPISRKLAASFGEMAIEFDDELENMKQFLAALARNQEKISHVTLRLHPSEDREKYDKVIGGVNISIPLSISNEKMVFNDIIRHDIIVGIESNALVIATLIDKDVFSCITGKQWRISLPHREIKKLMGYDELFARYI